MSDELAALRAELARQQKINAALMRRVERDMNVQGDAFSLFQAATVLEKKVHERTAALEAALGELQTFNRELRAAKEAAEAAARSKDEFLAGMSHELRTPLNAVLGLSELLQEEIYGALNEKQSEALKTIETSGRHLLSLINDILEIARMGSGEVQLRLSKVKVADLCEDCVDLIRAQASKKELIVCCEIAADVPELKTDARRFKQILVNLLGNAVKFTDKGGKIGLCARIEGPNLWLEVWDSGIGIKAEDCERIFLPFVQLDSGLSRKYDGTGLGLALVKQLTDLLGGEVSVESTLGVGSRFRVRFALRAGESLGVRELAPASMRQTELAGAGQLILLAEDNEANIATIGSYLRHKGYQVEVAQNGKIALEKVRALSPALVLMDVQMPEMDGLEATRLIRQEPGFEHLPVIALTALAMAGDRERGILAGVNEYVTKPVSLRELVGVIEAHLPIGRARLLQRPPSVRTGA
jgi:signal transduction histidine kinase/ActR/RegA family two-component response regulator